MLQDTAGGGFTTEEGESPELGLYGSRLEARFLRDMKVALEGLRGLVGNEDIARHVGGEMDLDEGVGG